MRSSPGLVIDLFAGGGGASTGIEAALGRSVDVAAVTARFASHVLVAPGEACWEWRGGRLKRPDGALSYGVFCIGKQRFLAHRFAWMLVHGAILDGQVIRHGCDNVACVRVDHLEPGTQAQNLADMRERGRAFYNTFPVGAAHPNSKLDPDHVREIRALYAAGGVSLATLGERFGLTASTVHDVVRRRTWREVA